MLQSTPKIHSDSVAHRGKHVNPVAARQDAVTRARCPHVLNSATRHSNICEHVPPHAHFYGFRQHEWTGAPPSRKVHAIHICRVIIKHSAITCHHSLLPHALHRGAQRAACPSAQAATVFTSECRGSCLLQPPMPRRVLCCSCAVVFVSHLVIHNGITTEIATPSIDVFSL